MRKANISFQRPWNFVDCRELDYEMKSFIESKEHLLGLRRDTQVEPQKYVKYIGTQMNMKFYFKCMSIMLIKDNCYQYVWFQIFGDIFAEMKEL